MSKLKQEDLAELLGGAWTQQKLSQLEARKTIEGELLEDMAKALKVPVEAIKDYNEETVFYNIQNKTNRHVLVFYYQMSLPFGEPHTALFFSGILRDQREMKVIIKIVWKIIEMKPLKRYSYFQ